FAEALELVRKGHELGSKRRDWPHPSAKWVRQCERLAGLDERLPALLQGKARFAGPGEQVEFAAFCRAHKRLYRTAARWVAGGFEASSELAEDLTAGHRYEAARAAARAGAGQGKDAAPPDGPERARWREQALDWLRADLALLRRHVDTEEDHPALRQRLRGWL